MHTLYMPPQVEFSRTNPAGQVWYFSLYRAAVKNTAMADMNKGRSACRNTGIGRNFMLLTEIPERVETVNAQEVPGSVHLSSSTASHQPDAVEEVQTRADEQDDDTGRVASSPYYLVVGVEN